MTPDNETQLVNTSAKLQELQQRYDVLRADQTEDPRVRRLTLMSLRRLINQLTEEIARLKTNLHHV